MDNSYEAEIAAKVAEWETAGRDLEPRWITHEICMSHQPGIVAESSDGEFWKYFAYKACRKDVGAFIVRNYGDEDSSDTRKSQPFFPGFDYVQQRYVVRRNGEDVGVLAMKLTDDEIYFKATDLRRRGSAHIQHADELVRFAMWRKEQAKSAQ